MESLCEEETDFWTLVVGPPPLPSLLNAAAEAAPPAAAGLP